jgi:Zn-dependent protease
LAFSLTNTLYLLPGIIIGLTFHEFAHAQTAVWLGDNTPRLQGRTSLNPIVHIDIIGFILLLIAHFGWAKPVQINPSNFKNPRRDDILVSLAGPAMNILVACLCFIVIKIMYLSLVNLLDFNTFTILVRIFANAAYINIILCLFNLLPLPPLDGSHIVFGLAGKMYGELYFKLARMSMVILIVLILTRALNKLIFGPASAIDQLLQGIFL